MAGSDRSEYDVRQPAGYSAFIPRPLPPAPALDLARLAGPLSSADQALGRLDGTTRLLPDRDLFLAMYVRREALLSSQIEGTGCTLDDVLSFDLDPSSPGIPQLDVREVVNYVAAMSHGLERLAALPVSSRLLREVHARLLAVGRGSDRQPGELRSSQNWIGPPGCTPAQATFVPPPVDDMKVAMSDLEKFIAATAAPGHALPLLVVCGLVHALREDHRRRLEAAGATVNDLSLLDKLFTQPLVNAKWVGDALGVTPATANAVLSRFVKVGALREVTGRARNRVFRFDGYLALFDQPVTDRVRDETGSGRG